MKPSHSPPRSYWAAWLLQTCGWIFVYRLIHLLHHRSSGVVRNMLVVRLNNLGTVLMATPTIRALRWRFSQSRITCLIKPTAEIVLRDNPGVDDLIFFDAPWYPQNHFSFRRR